MIYGSHRIHTHTGHMKWKQWSCYHIISECTPKQKTECSCKSLWTVQSAINLKANWHRHVRNGLFLHLSRGFGYPWFTVSIGSSVSVCLHHSLSLSVLWICPQVLRRRFPETTFDGDVSSSLEAAGRFLVGVIAELWREAHNTTLLTRDGGYHILSTALCRHMRAMCQSVQ